MSMKDRAGFLSKQMRRRGYLNYLLSANPYITADFGYDDFDDNLELLYQSRFEALNDADKREMYRLRKERGTTGKIISTLIGRGDIKLLFKGALNRVVGSSFVTAIYHQYQYGIQKWPFEKGAKMMVEHLRSKVLSDGHAGGRFVVINMMEAHEPYFRKPILNMKLNLNQEHYRRTVDGNFLDNLWNAYRKEVGYIKEILREILDLLREVGELDGSLIVVTSDHGQLLGEHDQLGHGTFLYDELIRVPLFIKYPSDRTLKEAKQKGRYISLTSLYDLISKGEEGYDEEHLFSDAAFSETYGISNIFKPTMDCEREKIKLLERWKIAIFHNGFKGIFDAADQSLEEVSSQRGKEITIGSGSNVRTVRPREVVGPPRDGISLVYSGDTSPCDEVEELARGATVLIHEATFADSHREVASGFGHSTASGAAALARRAKVSHLFLVHISPRYQKEEELKPLIDQATEVFEGATVPEDGDVIEITH